MNFIKKRNLPELLAPAGSFEHLKAAVAAGADEIGRASCRERV